MKYNFYFQDNTSYDEKSISVDDKDGNDYDSQKKRNRYESSDKSLTTNDSKSLSTTKGQVINPSHIETTNMDNRSQEQINRLQNTQTKASIPCQIFRFFNSGNF